MTAVLQRGQAFSTTESGQSDSRHHVVIIGGGFGGLYAAKALGSAPVKVTLIDKRNHHLFQPLLYQVATGALSAGDISSPLRAVLSRQKNTRVLMGEVTGIEAEENQVRLKNGEVVSYDSLIVATGVSHHYFGRDDWANIAPGIKTIEDALEVRRRIFLAFEAAEQETDPERRKALMTFVVVGGGPTGVELAGALAELAHGTLRDDFRDISSTDAEILLLEGMDRVLPPFPENLSAEAQSALEALGVTVRTQTMVTNIDGNNITLRHDGQLSEIQAGTVLWAAGMKASPVGQAIAQATGAELDRVGRVMVEPDMSVAGHPNLYVVGDLAHYAHQGERPLPGVAAVAMQQGDYVAQVVRCRVAEKPVPTFQYKDKGSMAVIGRHAAVAQVGSVKFAGLPAWLVWVFVHIYYLIEFDSKLRVLTQWAWNYATRKRGVRLITGHDQLPVAESASVAAEEPVKV